MQDADKSNKKHKGNILRIIIIVIAAVVLVYCLFNIISYYSNIENEENEYFVLRSSFANAPAADDEDSFSDSGYDYDSNDADAGFLTGYFNDEKYIYDPSLTDRFDSYANVDIAGIREDYPDVTAWIYIPGTKIAYPLLASEGNQYLYRNYLGKSAKSGSIFYFNDSSFDPQDDNIVIFGHNMKSGMMFGSLKAFWLEDSMWPDDKPLYLYLVMEEKIQKYELFSIYIDNPSKNKIPTSFSSGKDKMAYYEKIMDKSYKKKDIGFSENDLMLTLSTCTHINNAGDADRLLMHAVLIQETANNG